MNTLKYSSNTPTKKYENTLGLHFSEFVYTKVPKNENSKQQQKNCLLRAKHLHQERQFYTYPVGDVGYIRSAQSMCLIYGLNFILGISQKGIYSQKDNQCITPLKGISSL